MAKKPKDIKLYDGFAECFSGSFTMEEAASVDIMVNIYTPKDIRRLRKWLDKAEKWLEGK